MGYIFSNEVFLLRSTEQHKNDGIFCSTLKRGVDPVNFVSKAIGIYCRKPHKTSKKVAKQPKNRIYKCVDFILNFIYVACKNNLYFRRIFLSQSLYKNRYCGAAKHPQVVSLGSKEDNI